MDTLNNIAVLLGAITGLITTAVCAWLAVTAWRSHQSIQEVAQLIRALRGTGFDTDIGDGHGRSL